MGNFWACLLVAGAKAAVEAISLKLAKRYFIVLYHRHHCDITRQGGPSQALDGDIFELSRRAARNLLSPSFEIYFIRVTLWLGVRFPFARDNCSISPERCLHVQSVS